MIEDIEHYARIISGCESINLRIAGGPKLTEDGRYAQTVLRLHAEDAGLYAGQEGFFEKVKEGAKNIKDWIIKLIKAIRDWFKGSQIQNVDKQDKALKEAESQVEAAIKNPDILKKSGPEPTPAKTNKETPKQAPASSSSKLGYSPSKSKEENSSAIQERYKVVLKEIKASGAESLTRALELLVFVNGLDKENIMKEKFGYGFVIDKQIGSLRRIQENMKKDQGGALGNNSYDISAVVKELLKNFELINAKVETYVKRTDLDPEYDKTYFPFAAKIMKEYGRGINTLIIVHSNLADQFFKLTGIRQTQFK